MKPTAESAILAKLEAITHQWEVINERLDHMGVPREQVGCTDTRQDEDHSSCELRGKNVSPYTPMNVVLILPSVGVHESSFCDTLNIVRSHEDQTLVIGTQTLVDPLDVEIDSPHENDLCPSNASTYNLTKGKQNDQSGIDDIDYLECLENPSCDYLCEDDFDYGPLATRDSLYVCEDYSCERQGDMFLEIPSTSSLCISHVGHIPSGDFETSKGLLNFEDDTLGESESGQDLSPWLRLPFDPGLDSRSNPFQEGENDTSQMATLIFEYIIGDHHLKTQDLVTPGAKEYERNTHFKPTIEHTIHQGREWKIAWSIEDSGIHGFRDLISHGFGQSSLRTFCHMEGESFQGYGLLALGILTFLPGFYEMRIAYYSWRGAKGYRFTVIPDY
ncbi:putative protein kinase G11A-like isoform X1 [Capsicum annuum]|nr:putative protein kinase G11A-like isoform X1 [Capsicum annuum]